MLSTRSVGDFVHLVEGLLEEHEFFTSIGLLVKMVLFVLLEGVNNLKEVV